MAKIMPSKASVFTLWWLTTRSTTVITSSGGIIASALSVIDAMQTSRIARFSKNTRLISQLSENGLSASAIARNARISSTSPLHASAIRSSSTGTGSAPESAAGLRSQTRLRDASLATISAADPSFINKTTGGGGFDAP